MVYHKIKNAIAYNQSIQQPLQEINEPLKALGIDHFAYYKFYKKGWLMAMTTEEPMETIIENNAKGLCYPEPYLKSLQKGKYAYIWPDGNNENLEVLGIHLWNGLNFYIDRGPYVEFWGYSRDTYSSEMTEFYINNLGFLEKYINHVKDKLEFLVNQADESCVFKANLPEPSDHIKVPKNLINLDSKRYHLTYHGVKFYLTPQEFKCLNYLAAGYAHKEICQTVGISIKTLEGYFKNIKDKARLLFSSDLRKLAVFVRDSF